VRIRYVCEYCQRVIGQFETDQPDEARLGLANLTEEEKADIISIDAKNNVMDILSMCDDCVGELEDEDDFPLITNFWWH
jgi:hypothetical protein